MAVDAVVADLLELVTRHPDPPTVRERIGQRQVAVDRLPRLNAVDPSTDAGSWLRLDQA